MALVWQDLSFCPVEPTILKILKGLFSCCITPGKRKVLEDMNGSIHFGELTALMGPSGAGKSTLLKCLTGGKTYPGFGGKVMVPSRTEVRAAFITQTETDHLLMTLTVGESLTYACKLKNAGRPGVNCEEIVNDVLLQLDLIGKKDNCVEKCSGGEKRRVAIGMELTSDKKPNFLFLDEPTTGLDSFGGLKLIRLLRNVAIENQMAIVATIHQPSYKMLRLFDNLYVLTNAGRCVYTGPPMQLAAEIMQIDATQITQDNPSDVIIEIASNDKPRPNPFNKRDAEKEAAIVDPALQAICLRMTNNHKGNSERRGYQMREIQEEGLCKNSVQFVWWNLWCLWIRTWISSTWRQKRFLLIRFTLHGVVALVLAGLYDRGIGLADGCFCLDKRYDTHNCSCVESEEKLREESMTSKNVKFQFFSLLFLMFAALMPTVLAFPSEIKVFLNEHRNGWYTTTSYYFSKTIAEIPFQAIFSFCYIYFLYWYTKQVDMDFWNNGMFGWMPWRYSYFLGITLLCCFIAQGLGFLIGILCVNSPNITIIVSSSALLFLFLFSGFFVKTSQMAPSVEWITYLSFVRFGFESILIVLYGFERCGLTPDTSPIRIPTQPIVLFTFDLKDDDLKANLFWLIAHFVFLRFLAFMVLKVRADPKFISNIVGLCSSRLSVAETSNSITPEIARVCRMIGKVVFFVIKWSLIIFAVQLVLGIVIIVIQAFS